MASTQKQLLETIKQQCQSADERFPDYRYQLFAAVADILATERSHRDHPTNVVQKITDKCEALGDLIARESQR